MMAIAVGEGCPDSLTLNPISIYELASDIEGIAYNTTNAIPIA
jgi:hypothetical protein